MESKSFAAVVMTVLHPSRRSLVAFAAGGAFPGRGRVARHLERCSECRQLVGFTQRLERAVATLPPGTAGESLLARALADRAAGMRVILPATVEPARPGANRRAMAAMAVLIVIAMLGAWWSDRGGRANFTSANELLLAGFVPKSAEAGQGGRDDRPLTHHLRPLAASYQRRFIDSAGHSSAAGQFDIRVAQAEAAWLVTSQWHGIAGRDDMQGAAAWVESVTVADTALAPSTRIAHVTPYRKWAGIYIRQRFRNDSVVGQMSLDQDPTRRAIARSLRGERDRLIAADALAPLYFMGVPLLPGAEFDVAILGWAVVPRDFLVRMHMKVVGSERVETPAGTFDCWKFAITVGGATHYHWVRKSDHLGVLTRRPMADGRARELILVQEGMPR